MIERILLFVVITFFISCAKDDSPIQKDEKKIEIFSFIIEENTETGVKTTANLEIVGYKNFSFQNHGVMVYHKGSLVKKIEQGELTKNSFESVIRSGVIKDNTYTVVPYVVLEDKFTYGDTLGFTSNVDIKIRVKEIKPLRGFVYDTIYITGENFCKSLADTPTRFLLNDSFQNIIYESDSLIKAIVTPNINASKLTPTLRNCGVDTLIQATYKINPAVLDSISSIETYVGENSFIYGKNFHAQISNVWINDIEVQLNTQRLDINKLEMTIPKGLPAGLLNLKIKVLDTIIEKQDYYKSTSPIITSLDKRDTGFLDTLTIKGNYLKQKDLPTKVYVGGREQKIIRLSKDEVQIVISEYFGENSSKLVLKTGSFELEENINMLPPEIISFDKDSYHLDDDFITLKTKYFIAGVSYNIIIGGVTLRNYYNNFEDVNAAGSITLSMSDWLEAKSQYPQYVFNGTGKLKVEIETQFGTSEKNISISPPIIESIAKNSLFANTYTDNLKLSGLDFGYDMVSKVYIDNELVKDPGTSDYTLSNKAIKFIVPQNIGPGNHKLKVQTGGQFSNEITFNVKEITTSGLTTNSGIRELDIFTIEGKNLENKDSYVIRVNDVRCDIVSTSNTQVQFTIPYHTALENNMLVTLAYGPEMINVGYINGIEPYSKLNNYKVPSDYYDGSSYFEYEGELYFLNLKGIYRFDETSENWVSFETTTPFTSYYDSLGKNHISEVGDKIYIPWENKFHIYDMRLKRWEAETVDIELGDGYNMIFGVVDDNYAYIMQSTESTSPSFIKYNLLNHKKETINQPPFIRGHSDILYYHEGKIYLDVRDYNITVYDIKNDSWEDIGYPRGNYKYFYDNNLYVHNNVLYFSGGQGNLGLEFKLYAYDLTTKEWALKTPTLLKLGKHAVWGSGEFLYFGLGNHTYTSFENDQMLKYDIKNDPR